MPKIPNINLRVFRREKNDMTLIYNRTELLSFSQYFEYIPSVYIGNKKINFIQEEARAKDSSTNDMCIFISCEDNELNDVDRYIVTIIFSPKLKKYNNINPEYIPVAINELKYNITVEPRGVLPQFMKDNKQMFSQMFGYDNKKNEWGKLHILEDKYNQLLVRDNETIKILSEIKEILSKIVK